MNTPSDDKEFNRQIPVFKVKQWLQDWEHVQFSDKGHLYRKKPSPHFFLFSLSASLLQSLVDAYPRTADKPRALDENIQREPDEKRSAEISRFIRYGFPWSTLSQKERESEEYEDLVMPGWLPTAILVNILPDGAVRRGKTIRQEDLITIEESNGFTIFNLPEGINHKRWQPPVRPLEVIDGQHRLLAFKDTDLEGDFDLPVVAFYDLDITWKAYLFYTINIKPKRINTSLAYDLYPILRIQEWLERADDGLAVYREVRAQEITEILWSYPDSPWRGLIDMLSTSRNMISQAAFIRALVNTFLRRGSIRQVPGLFSGQGRYGEQEKFIPWSRTQQATFVLYIWSVITQTLSKKRPKWAQHLRKYHKDSKTVIQTNFLDEINLDEKKPIDFAFASRFSMLSSDQGVRAVCAVINDLVWLNFTSLSLDNWTDNLEEETTQIDNIEIATALHRLEDIKEFTDFIQAVGDIIINFDWRTAGTPNIEQNARNNAERYRGAGGYRALQNDLLTLLSNSDNKNIKETVEKLPKSE
jgi:DGQHR domain-containing protein